MSKLDAFLAKLAAKKREIERQARRDRGEPSDASDASSSDKDDDDRESAGLSTRDASTSLYGSKAYWDDRYKDGCTIGGSSEKGKVSNEWYVGYDAMREDLLRYAGRNQAVLLLGCGTSTLGEDMARDGFSRVAAVDYSESCISTMRRVQGARLREAEAAATGIEIGTPPPCEVDYRVMDVTEMAYEADAVDCVLDKATLDTMCQLDDDPSAAGSSARRMLIESFRVLKPGGHYVCLTYGDPESRLGLFGADRLEWDGDGPVVRVRARRESPVRNDEWLPHD